MIGLFAHQFPAMNTLCLILCLVVSLSFAKGNTPPTILADRSWDVTEDTAMDEKISQIRASDPDKDSLLFFISSSALLAGLHLVDGSQFFRIDAATGKVFLAKSLRGMQGKRLMLTVGVNDGVYNVKMDIAVRVASSHQTHPPNIQDTRIANEVVTVSHSPGNESSQLVTGVEPAPTSPRPIQSTPHLSTPNEGSVDGDLQPMVAKQETGTSVAAVVIPVVVAVVGVVLFMLGFLIVRRKKRSSAEGSIDGAQPSKSKANAAKAMNPSANQETITLQHWISKKAVSNRYESWHIGEIDQAWRNQNTTEDGWEFPRHRLRVISILGEGCFGQVWKCEAQNIAGCEGSSFVAVKTLKESAGDKERQELLKELQVMKTIKPHPNIVTLLGCCTDKDPVFVIMEYINGGILQTFLRKSRAEHYYGNLHGASSHLSSRDLTSFAYQVARAMDYLKNKDIIHRDLAARNVLITDERVCKVADFGFARDIMGSQVYQRKSEGRLPIRWMAPESLYDNLFSSKTDVWSFGILLWEIVTLGSTPYPGMAATEVMQRVRKGYRLDKPEHCKRELYNVMFYCWEKDPDQRPTFTELVELLEQLLTSENDYIQLEHFPDHSYYNMIPPNDEIV